MRTDGRDLAGCIAAQAGARGRGALPAQAHVAAWVAEHAREGARPGWMPFWAEPASAVLGREKKRMSPGRISDWAECTVVIKNCFIIFQKQILMISFKE